MDYGLCCYSIGDGDLALRLGARWAHAFADITEGIPDHSALIDDMVTHGCAPVIDVRTETAVLGAMIAGDEPPRYDPPTLQELREGDAPPTDDEQAWLDGARAAYDQRYGELCAEFEASIGDTRQRCKATIGWYAQSIMEYLYRHPRVRDIEVWGSAEVARFIHGHGELLDYSSILRRVYETVKEHHPEVRIWTGGFGHNCDCVMLERGLAVHSPEAFDVCNLHPFLMTTGHIDIDRESLSTRLRVARRILDAKCKGQPFAASGVGIPTLPFGPPPAAYGRFWRVGVARALPEGEALDWWLMLLGVLREAGFEAACLLARDTYPPPGEQPRMHHFSGLLHADGTNKAFTEELCREARNARSAT